MKRSIIWLIMILSATAFSTMACSSSLVDRVQEGGIIIDTIESRHFRISRAVVYQEGENLIVSGKVKRKTTALRGSGHVDVVILGPDHSLLYEGSTLQVPAIVRRKGSRESRFTVAIPVTVREGSFVRIGYHDTTGMQRIYRCGTNCARP